MTVAIADYGAGNVFSVSCALRRLGAEPVLTARPEVLLKADRVIIPGVGRSKPAMQALEANGLLQVIPTLRAPVLGICLGLQIMCAHSSEDDTTGLGIFPNTVEAFPEPRRQHVGWSLTRSRHDAPPEWYYYVHGYRASVGEYTVATADFGGTFSAVLRRANFTGVQFHPEKSAASGALLLKTFLATPWT